MKINDWLKKGEQNFGGKKYFEVAAATYFVHPTNIAIQFNVICHGVWKSNIRHILLHNV